MKPEVSIKRPHRWDTPFSADMTSDDVQRLLRIAPFRDMDPSRFSAAVPLPGILRNDTRVRVFQSGDLILREGDYGHSAFLILRGSVHAVLKSLPASILGRPEPRKRPSAWSRVVQRFLCTPYPEQRDLGSPSDGGGVTARRMDGETQVFVQDIPRLLRGRETVRLVAGELFGEVAALARTPYAATVLAAEPVALLEIRWQGLRELMRRAPEWKRHVEQLYRDHSLIAHLRETPFLNELSTVVLERIARETLFESYGDFEWQREFRRFRDTEPSDRIQAEPVVAEENSYPDGLILIRSGFARLSQRFGQGHRTLAYLGRGHSFGLEALAAGWKHGRPQSLFSSLRAIGYLDILRVPTLVVEQHILAPLSVRQWDLLDREIARSSAATNHHPEPTTPNAVDKAQKSVGGERHAGLDTRLLEFILDDRLMNGRQAMVIDLDRCTRCDDCVRACATAHDNNPRFVRQGPRFERYQFASACMHCVDPVCMIGCPTGAIGREPFSGNVLINEQTCIGCSTCAQNCPYENIRMVEIGDRWGKLMVEEDTRQPLAKATKCDLCHDQTGGPACQRACPHDALVRLDMNDLSAVNRWFARHSE